MNSWDEANLELCQDDIEVDVDPREPSDEDARFQAVEELQAELDDDLKKEPIYPPNGSIDGGKQKRQTQTPEQRYAKLRETYRFDPPMTLRQIVDAEFTDDYIIEDCLVANQPCLAAGEFKSLKTTFEIARCISLISGQPFLNKFRVNRTCRVFFATAESGRPTVQKTLLGLARAAGVNLRDLPEDQLIINWWVPRVSNLEMLEYFTYEAEKSKADVCIIDPLYQVLDDQQASMVLNGQQLATLSNRILNMGATPVMVDHVKRSSQNAKDRQPLELGDTSGAGKAEFFRQWFLVSRRSKFEPSPIGEPHQHAMWLSLGGSAGHSSVWAVDIAEHVQRDRGRDYDIEVRSRSEVVTEVQEAAKTESKSRADQKAAKLEERMQRKANELIDNVFKGDHTLALSQTDIEGRLAVSGSEIKRVMGIVLGDGRLKLVAKSIEKNGRKYDGYMLGQAIGATSTWVS